MRIITMLLLLCCSNLFGNAQEDMRKKFWMVADTDQQPAIFDTSVLYITRVAGFKPDLERICQINITNNSGVWQATCTARPFTKADSGKVLIVKNARSYPQYRKLPFTLNATIADVSAEGNATIVSYDKAGSIIAVTGHCGFVATDNFDAMQRAIDTCEYRNKKKLIMSYEGTAYVVPERSIRPRPRSNQPALVVNSELMVIGRDSGLTRLKWGMEDVSLTNEVAIAIFAGFWIKQCSFTLKKMTLESPDRGSTFNDHQNMVAINGDPDFNTGQKIYVDSSNIVSVDSSGFYGWGNLIYINGAATNFATDTAIISVTNSRLVGQGGISFYSRRPDLSNPPRPVDTLNRLVRLINNVHRGGATYTHKHKGAAIRMGSDTIVVHDPTFSFYDFTSYDLGLSKQPVIAIARYGYTAQALGPNEVYWSQIKKVINDTTALFDTTHRQTFYTVTGECHFNTGSNLVKTAGGGFNSELAPGDSIYSNDLFKTYIGKVQSIKNDDTLYLTTNATINGVYAPCLRHLTTLILPAGTFGTNYRLQPVRWATDTATIYTSRGVARYSAFPLTYISGNLGVAYYKSSFQALGPSRNAQNVCNELPKCGSCLNGESTDPAQMVIDRNLSLLYNQLWYRAASELKVIVFGFANTDIVGGSFEFLPAAKQKY